MPLPCDGSASENSFLCEQNVGPDSFAANLSVSTWEELAGSQRQTQCNIDRPQNESLSLEKLDFGMDLYKMAECKASDDRDFEDDLVLDFDLGVEFLLNHPCPDLDTKYEERNDPEMIKTARAGLAEGDPLKERIFDEYGAVFAATDRVVKPTRCIFESDEEVKEFQTSLELKRAVINGRPVELQAVALRSLLEAIKEAKGERPPLRITPRQARIGLDESRIEESSCEEIEKTEATLRSYEKTEDLWKDRVEHGLKHWLKEKRLTPEEVNEIRMLSPKDQVPVILQLEEDGLFFSKNFKKSILHSVSAPGSSQHIAGLAIDIAEFDKARAVMNKHGWFQTVVSDLPHFTYLGVDESKLEKRGLQKKVNGGRVFWVPKK